MFIGFRSFGLAFRLATEATHSSLPDLTCGDYKDLSSEFGNWSFTILFCLPALNYVLYVMSRGTSHYQTLIPIALPFTAMRREVSIVRVPNQGRVMKMKEYWMIGDHFVMSPQRLRNRLGVLRYGQLLPPRLSSYQCGTGLSGILHGIS